MVAIFPPDGRNPIDGIKTAVIGFHKPIVKEKIILNQRMIINIPTDGIYTWFPLGIL